MQSLPFVTALQLIAVRVFIHYAAMTATSYATGHVHTRPASQLSPDARRLRTVVWAWFIWFSIGMSTMLYAGPWWFWGVVFTVDYSLVGWALWLRRSGRLDDDLVAMRLRRRLKTPRRP
jgi:hypothetical protein